MPDIPLRLRPGPTLAAGLLLASLSVSRGDSYSDSAVRAADTGPSLSAPSAAVYSAAESASHGIVLLKHLATAPRIDADLSDWPRPMPGLSMPGDCGAPGMGGGEGTGDLQALLRAGWDDSCFYLATVVYDDRHHAPSGLPMWHRDSLRIAVDPLHERTLGGLGANDSELAFALLNDGRTVMEAVQAPQLPDAPGSGTLAAGAGATASFLPIELDAGASGIHFAARPADGSVVYELAIPWTLLGVPVPAGSVHFGFNLAIVDNDGLNRDNWLELAPGFVPAWGMERNAAAYATAVGATDPLLLLTAGGIARPDRPMRLTVALFSEASVPAGASLTIGAGGWHPAAADTIRVPVPEFADGMAVTETEWTARAARPGTTRLSAILSDSNGVGLAAAACDIVVGPPAAEVRERLQALRPKLSGVVRLAETAEAQGIATDYQRVALATADLFIDYGVQDLAAGLVEKTDHVVQVLDEALDDAATRLRTYLSGRARPPQVPRYRTGRVEVRDGAFWGDTEIPSTGTRARRPVFFMGYGFFKLAVADIPRFEALGCNVIESAREGGGGGTVVAEDTPVEGFTINSIPRGARHNVAVEWMSNTEYFPHWARNKWPELEGAGGAFYDIKVDAPQARKIFRLNLETCLGAIGDNPALLAVCLLNEPTSEFWEKDQFRLALWSEYLRDVHGTIERLNVLEGSEYPSFKDVPVRPTTFVPPDEEMTPLWYDQLRFNMDRFAEFHRFLTDVIHEVRPGTLTFTETMAGLGRESLHYGTDPDQFSYVGDLNGNDTWNKFVGFGDRYATHWWREYPFYDLQRSLRPAPIINSENHIIAVNDPREIPPAHTDCVLWQGCIHGMAASMIWVWEHYYEDVKVENPPDYYNNDTFNAILTRPENVMAVGRVGLDLMRLAPEVYRMQAASSPVAILYGITAQIWSERASSALLRACEAMTFTGLPVVFLSERQVREGDLSTFRAIVLPSIRHAPDDVARAIEGYASGGGNVWIIGDPTEALAHDEYGRAREWRLPESAALAWPESTSAMDLRAFLLRAFDAVGVQRHVRLEQEDGSEPWAVDYRAVPDGSGYLVSMANYWGTPKKVRIVADGEAPSMTKDLRGDRMLRGGFIELNPLQAMLLRVE